MARYAKINITLKNGNLLFKKNVEEWEGIKTFLCNSLKPEREQQQPLLNPQEQPRAQTQQLHQKKVPHVSIFRKSKSIKTPKQIFEEKNVQYIVTSRLI
jgi:hypothetical protein